MKVLNHIIQASFIALLAAGLGSFLTHAQTQTSVPINQIKELLVPFSIKSFAAGNPDLVRVQLVGPQKLNVTGLRLGQTDLKVVGEADQTETFRITVGSTIRELVLEVKKILEDVPGVEVGQNSSDTKVLLTGTVKTPEEWFFLKKTVLPAYGDQLQSMVKFRVQEDLLVKIKGELEKVHFKVVEDYSPDSKPGVLGLHSVGNNVFINGRVISQGELDAINKVISANPWLKIRRDDKESDDACYAVINVTLAPVMIEVDVTFLGVTDKEATTLGANILRNGLSVVEGAFNLAGDTVSGFRGGGNFKVSGTMKETVWAITGGEGAGPGRFIQQGHLTFRNGATEWKVFHDGGTLQIPVSGTLGSVGMQALEYGLILRIKGGLADSTNADLDVNLEFCIPVANGTGAAGPIFDMQKSKLESTLLCPVGQTMIMAGTKQLTESINIKSAVPLLSKVPVLQFIFSEKGHLKTDRQILVLVSPQIAGPPTAAQPLVDQTSETTNKANKPLSILNPKL